MPPKSLSVRVDRLEEMFTDHIKESGGIRADLNWLTRAAWTAAAALLTGVGALIVALLTKR